MPDCCMLIMEFLYYHPGKEEASLRFVYDLAGGSKIVWEDKKPTGAWSFHSVPPMRGQLSGIDTSKPILRVKFNSRGLDDLADGVLYGVVSGATNVYRLIGSDEADVGGRIYTDSEMAVMKLWHVVLVCTTCLEMPA